MILELGVCKLYFLDLLLVFFLLGFFDKGLEGGRMKEVFLLVLDFVRYFLEVRYLWFYFLVFFGIFSIYGRMYY